MRSVIRACIICQKYEGQPYNLPHPPDLPQVRVSEDPPFTHTGLDFAGPLYVKDKSAEAKEDKVHVCLFTCASVRGVHLELTRGLDVNSFLLAFHRFTSRRGLPATIISDNAKTFKCSSKEVVKIARSNEVMRFLANQQITWKFIVEKAPWWGVCGKEWYR